MGNVIELDIYRYTHDIQESLRKETPTFSYEVEFANLIENLCKRRRWGDVSDTHFYNELASGEPVTKLMRSTSVRAVPKSKPSPTIAVSRTESGICLSYETNAALVQGILGLTETGRLHIPNCYVSHLHLPEEITRTGFVLEDHFRWGNWFIKSLDDMRPLNPPPFYQPPSPAI